MKTLDEVIKAYEICHASVLSCEGCPYDNGERYRDSDCYIADALHHLKEYRSLQTAYITAMADLEDNPPLTWDELKQMEGKPVWVEECNGDTKGWLLILRTNYDVINCTTKHGNSFYLYKSSYSEKWQAYMKEPIQ